MRSDRTRLRRMTALLVGFVVLLSACAADDPLGEAPADDGDPGAITVGSADFPEALLLGNIAAGALEAQGFEVEKQLNIGTREIYFPAMQNGDIDVLMEYAGALLSFLTGGTDSTDTAEIMEELRAELDGEEIVVLDPSSAENRNALAVTQETADEYDLQTVSDLAPVGDELVLGGPPEYRERRVGLPGLEEVYGIEFASFRELDAGGPLTVSALEQGDIDVGVVFTTQGVIDEMGWVVLEEDRPLIPAENIVPVVRAEVATDGVRAVLSDVASALTTDDLVQMNRRMEVEEEDPQAVADDWLAEHGFVE